MERQAISSDLIRGHIDTIILYTLMDGDKFAQQISDTIASKSDNQYEINQATLYSSLKRLENLKYVVGYWNDSDNGRRRFFKLTELGRETIIANSENWSVSRSIIDKLMDTEPNVEVKEKIVIQKAEPEIVYKEKIVYVPTPQVKQEIPSVVEKEVAPVVVSQTKNTVQPQQENVQEINFRNILNNLIKLTTPKTEDITEKNQGLDKKVVESSFKKVEKTCAEDLKPIDKNNKQLKFNETIIDDDYRVSLNANGKIDFGDLSMKASKEGYRLLVSSKGNKVIKGSLYINRLNLCSSLAIFLIMLAEFLFLSLFYKTTLNFSAGAVVGCVLFMLVLPVYSLIMFLRNPLKTTSKPIKKDSILTMAIIAFNLSLVTFAFNMLFNSNFSDLYVRLLGFVFPVVIFVDVFIFTVIRFLFSRMKDFIVVKK